MTDAAGPSRDGAPTLTVVFPAYNDAGTIASMVVAARLTARRVTDDFEIVVVNDGSVDQTGDILIELEKWIPELRVVHHASNQGYGSALRSGFARATKELVFYTDGDAQFDPRELTLLLEALTPDVDYVSGYKRHRADPALRVVLGRPYHALLRQAFGLKLRDVDCDFRLFRRSVLERLELHGTNGTFGIELLKKLEDARFRFREVPVNHYPRVWGRSQYYTLRHVLCQYVELFRLWLELSVRKTHLRPAPSSLPGVATADETNLAP